MIELRGLVKFKKNLKIREKLGLVRHHPPTRLPNFLNYFGNIKTTQKKTKFPKKKKFEFGLDPTTHFKFFFGFFKLKWQQNMEFIFIFFANKGGIPPVVLRGGIQTHIS